MKALCFSLVLSLTGVAGAADPIVDAAIQVIQRSGGVVNLAGNQLPSLSIHEQGVNDSLFNHIAKLDFLESLDLENTPFTKAVLPHVEAMPKLKRIVLAGTRIDRPQADELARKKPGLMIVWAQSAEGRKTAIAEAQRLGFVVTNGTDRKEQPGVIIAAGDSASAIQSLQNPDAWRRATQLLPDVAVVHMYNVRGNIFTDGHLQAVSYFAEMRELTVGHAVLSSKGFEALKGHQSLRFMEIGQGPLKTTRLFLSGSQLLAPLKTAPALEEVWLHYPSDEQLLGLRGAKNIKTLWITGLNSDIGLKVLETMPNLINLKLHGDKLHADDVFAMTDKTLITISKLKNLISLKVGSAALITDAGFAKLASGPPLVSLGVSGCPRVTDAGLAKFASSKTLAEITVEQSGITRIGFVSMIRQLESAGVVVKSAVFENEELAKR